MQVAQQPTMFGKFFRLLQDIISVFGGHQHDQYDHMRIEMHDIRSGLTNMKDEFEKLERLRNARLSNIERQLDRMENQVEKAENRQDSMRINLREEFMKVDNLSNARLSEIERRLDRMETKFQAAENEYEQMRRNRDDTRATLSNQKEQLLKLQNERETMIVRMSQIEKQLESMHIQLNNAIWIIFIVLFGIFSIAIDRGIAKWIRNLK